MPRNVSGVVELLIITNLCKLVILSCRILLFAFSLMCSGVQLTAPSVTIFHFSVSFCFFCVRGILSDPIIYTICRCLCYICVFVIVYVWVLRTLLDILSHSLMALFAQLSTLSLVA